MASKLVLFHTSSHSFLIYSTSIVDFAQVVLSFQRRSCPLCDHDCNIYPPLRDYHAVEYSLLLQICIRCRYPAELGFPLTLRRIGCGNLSYFSRTFGISKNTLVSIQYSSKSTGKLCGFIFSGIFSTDFQYWRRDQNLAAFLAVLRRGDVAVCCRTNPCKYYDICMQLK